MIHLSALLFAFCGLTALCVSMAKHQLEAVGRKLTSREQLRLRLGGWLSLAVAYTCAVAGQGWKFGSVAWVGTLILAALVLVVALMPHRPRLAPIMGIASGVLAAMLAVSAALIAIP